MRVLYFSRDYTPHDHRFLTALAESGDEILYLRLESRRTLESRSLPAGVDVVHWWGGKRRFSWADTARLMLELRGLLRRLKPDLVHAGPIHNCAFPMSLLGFRQLVSMSWGSDLLADARRGVRRVAAGFTLGRSAALIADCQAVRQAALALGMRNDRIVVFPWGVDLQHFRPSGPNSLRRDLGWEEAFVVLSTRAWEPIYGVDLVVDGFCRAAAFDRRLRLILLGGGSLAEQLHRKIDQEGVADRVHVAGQVEYDRLPEYYRASDLYLSGSRSDGSSVSLLEAMACGLPALVSDIPGNREWVEPGENGWWFSDGDVEELSDRIAQAAALDDLASFGQRGRSVAEARADWSRNAGMIHQAYQLALAVDAEGAP